jgi:hypothetical protein
VIDPAEAAVAKAKVSSSATQPRPEDGWYLYGITRRNPADGAPAWTSAVEHDVVATPLSPGPAHERVQLLEYGSLVAVVGRVDLADFSAEALQAHLSDPAWLEASVQLHNAVVRAVHQEQAILPAKFGAVYARLADITEAMERDHSVLLVQLEQLDGHDEWAVHVYVNQRIVQAQVRAEQAADPVHQQLAATRPGQAYFLRRKFDDDLATKTAQITERVALTAYQRVARLATAARAGRPASPSGVADGETEVLRAAFLVHRERSEEFVAEVRAHAGDEGEWRCTSSGPWPPYTFAAIAEENGDGQRNA